VSEVRRRRFGVVDAGLATVGTVTPGAGAGGVRAYVHRLYFPTCLPRIRGKYEVREQFEPRAKEPEEPVRSTSVRKRKKYDDRG
jgi:hypothetical protein